MKPLAVLQHWSKALIDLRACLEAVTFAATMPDFDTAWLKCERGDWMLWYAGKVSGPPDSASRKRLVLAACECARLSLKHVTDGEARPLAAIEAAERWARGEAGVTLTEVRRAAEAATAYAATASDAAAYAATASDAAAYAATASDADASDATAYATAYAASDATAYAATAATAYAATAATAAAYAAASDATAYAATAATAYAVAYAAEAAEAARKQTLAKCADIVRRHYPTPPIKEVA